MLHPFFAQKRTDLSCDALFSPALTQILRELEWAAHVKSQNKSNEPLEASWMNTAAIICDGCWPQSFAASKASSQSAKRERERERKSDTNHNLHLSALTFVVLRCRRRGLWLSTRASGKLAAKRKSQPFGWPVGDYMTYDMAHTSVRESHISLALAGRALCGSVCASCSKAPGSFSLSERIESLHRQAQRGR